MTEPTRQRGAVTPGDQILAEIADLLIAQSNTLREILDRLPRPTRTQMRVGRGAPVEVQEPAPKQTPEPAEQQTVPVTEPAPKAQPRRAARKTSK